MNTCKRAHNYLVGFSCLLYGEDVAHTIDLMATYDLDVVEGLTNMDKLEPAIILADN